MKHLAVAAWAAVLTACATPVARHTLREVDFAGQKPAQASAFAAPRSPDEIRKAYVEYLRYAAKDDKSRVDALHRLAQLEFEVSEKHDTASHDTDAEGNKDEAFLASIDRSIELLQTLLRDHPNDDSNDKTLYQLAKAYDQRGQPDKSLDTLSQLVRRYPKSPHYVESQFRLAEHAFVTTQYGKAEDIYTDILVTRNNGLFRDKSRYKRGWARFKQDYYREAADDFVAVINANEFDDVAHLSEPDKSNFDEYLRALSLTFVYQGGAPALTDYFKDNPTFKYLHNVYFRVSDAYLAQNRYSDAVGVLDVYNKTYPKSIHVQEAALKIVDIWASSGFSGNFTRSLDQYYGLYHPQSRFWADLNIDPSVHAKATTSLKGYLLLATSYFHKEYQRSKKEADFSQAKLWYERYLKDYAAYARKDNVHFLYAELLSQHKDYTESLGYYESAAYDGTILVNRDAAYAAILLTTTLHQRSQDPRERRAYLDKLVQYSSSYVRLYPSDPRATAIMTHAAQEAYRGELFQQAIDLTELYTDLPYTEATREVHEIKGHSYFKLRRFHDAEMAYQAVLQHYTPDRNSRKQLLDDLALSIYSQATLARDSNDLTAALGHFTRISDAVPESDIAASGLYDAICLTFDGKRWTESVSYMKKFQRLYPASKFSHDVSKKLSVAYLSTNQDTAAAAELLKVSRTDESAEYKIAALWKAAGLYESKKDIPSAIKAFEEYAATYPRPYPQNMEAMQKLTALYAAVPDDQRANHWRNRILDTDKVTPSDLKTDRTNYISSLAALQLARSAQQQYAAIRLVLPLNRSLGQKKAALQKAINLYGLAAAYGVRDTTTEATYSIAEIYHTFSKALLDSERPAKLSAAELEQYKILLEDQAFPFEDNAIKFHERNLAYTKQGVSDDWIRRSYDQLKSLFPARYNRSVMLEPYINVLH